MVNHNSKRKSIENIKINDMKSPAYIHQRVLNRDEIAVVCSTEFCHSWSTYWWKMKGNEIMDLKKKHVLQHIEKVN